jgi:hypothetical protein
MQISRYLETNRDEYITVPGYHPHKAKYRD